jgi:hypothetical protein
MAVQHSRTGVYGYARLLQSAKRSYCSIDSSPCHTQRPSEPLRFVQPQALEPEPEPEPDPIAVLLAEPEPELEPEAGERRIIDYDGADEAHELHSAIRQHARDILSDAKKKAKQGTLDAEDPIDMDNPLLETADQVADSLGVKFSTALYDKIVDTPYETLTDDISFQYDLQEDGQLSP